MSPTRSALNDLIREEVRTTIHDTVAPVIQGVADEELRSAFNEPLMEVIGLESRQAIEELRGNGQARSRRAR